MITSPRGKPPLVRPIAYDLEWDERCVKHDGQKPRGRNARDECHECSKFTFRVTLCGAFDEHGYRRYSSVRKFLRGELIRANAGKLFYAHFGGASDMVFLLRELVEDERYSIKGVFSGSAAILVSVKLGDLEWRFVDSFWLMRVSLKKIGDWIGLPKLEAEHGNMSVAELVEYNRRDCEILYRAICDLQRVLLEAGGELGVTAASTAMKTFRRSYLLSSIDNDPRESEWARGAYTASRVEKYRDTCNEARYYDINSSFPFSMTFPCPGAMYDSKVRPSSVDESALWIADCEVESDTYIPTLPFRTADRRVFFPNGRFRTMLTSEDYKAGGFKLRRLHQVRYYEDRDDLRQFALDFYRKRKEAGGFASEVYKIILNSLYGKFAERDEKTSLYVRPEAPGPDWEPLTKHCYLVREQVAVPHVHVPISTMITARSRRLLLEHMRAAVDAGGELYYVDTDSITTTAELPTGKELGALKLEYEIKKGIFTGSKLYAIETKDARELVKAKGFSRVVSHGGDRKPLTYEAFTALSEGGHVTIERMLRIRELLRREGEDYVPRNETQEKMLGKKARGERIMPRAKRCAIEGNDSRPWSVDELLTDDK